MMFDERLEIGEWDYQGYIPPGHEEQWWEDEDDRLLTEKPVYAKVQVRRRLT